MHSDRHLDLVRLTPEQRAAFFDRLDRDGAGVPLHRNRRSEPRWVYRSPDVLVAFDRPGGAAPFFRVLARNISANGIAVIHGGYVHPGTFARGLVRDLEGEAVPFSGRVAGCRHVEGALHEVRLRLEAPLDPARFIPAGSGAPVLDGDVPGLAGRVLHLQVAEIDGAPLRHLLDATSIELVPCPTVEEAVGVVAQSPPALVLVELDRSDRDGVSVVAKLRESGFAGPIVALTADPDPERHGAAKAAGATALLTKPFDRDALFSLLGDLLGGGAPTPDGLPSEDVIYSTLDADDGLKEMLLQFIDHAERMSGTLEAALDAQNLEQLRAACVHLKGAASGHGFSPLGEAATAALSLIDQTKSIETCASKVRELSAMCKKLGVGRAG